MTSEAPTAVTGSAACHLADGAKRLFAGWLSQLVEDDIHLFETDAPLMSADVIFACGLLTADAIDKGADLSVIAAPTFAGRAGPTYSSVLIARRGATIDRLLEGARVAVNEYDSWSGWNGLDEHRRLHNLEAAVLATRVLTGGHAESIAAVAKGRADVASIDITVWDDRTAEEDDRLVVIDMTRDWPAPPISIRTSLPKSVQRSIEDAILRRPEVQPATIDDYTFMLDQRNLTTREYFTEVTDA